MKQVISYWKCQGKGGVFFLYLLSFLLCGCVEEFEPETEFFESILVVEAVITDEMKQQEVVLTKTFRFEDNGPEPEQNAKVRIIEDESNVYVFSEIEPGRYLSVDFFEATPGKEYTLIIETLDGTKYSSDSTIATGVKSVLDNLYPVETTNDGNVEGISIRVDSFDPTGNAGYYRFEYEETYKIIAPRWAASEAIIGGPGGIQFIPREEEEQTCYATRLSNSTILANTTTLSENQISGLEVRFLSRNDYIIAQRYSILVRQFSTSREAFSYYRSLNEIAGSESIFSENQPGFIESNIKIDNDDSKKVIGYFDISSVASKRIFFNHDDFYPNDFPPVYPVNCTPFTVDGEQLEIGLRNKEIQYISTDDPVIVPMQPFRVVARACGDCTLLGSNIVPDFWQE